MAFQALYRKWRSQTFNELVGQEHVVKTLRNAIAAGRIGHAYLFTGPRGVGKTTVARLLAKSVNCGAAAPEDRPCDQCESCRAIADGRAVDVIEMDAASNRGVDDAREIIERVQFRPTSSRTKVYIIDETHMLTTEAFNALLKTLEEPPPHAMFILATTEVHKIPATIASRCQRFVFNRHSLQDTLQHLLHIAEAEEVELEPGAAEAMARAATGSLRDAVSILDQLMAYGEKYISAEMVRSLLGATAASEVRALVRALIEGEIGAALRAVNSVADQGADLRQFARDLVEDLRRLMLLKAGGDRSLIDAGEESLLELEALAEQVEVALLLGWLKIFSGLDHQLRTSPYGQLPLEMAVVEALVGAPPAQPLPVRSAPRPAPQQHAPQPAPQRAVERRQPQRQASVPPEPRELPSQDEPPQEDPPTGRPGPLEAPPAQPARPVEEPPPPAEEPPPAEYDLEEPDPESAAYQQVRPAAAGEELIIAESEVLLAQIEELWTTIIEDVKPHSPTVQALLRSCEPMAIEENILVIGARSTFHRDNLEKQQHRKIVEQVLSKALERTMGIRCELITGEQQANARDARRQREELLKDPVVKAARNIFDATILGVQREDGMPS